MTKAGCGRIFDEVGDLQLSSVEDEVWRWDGPVAGLCLDELVNLYKLANTQARNGNYEQILRILNDLVLKDALNNRSPNGVAAG